MSASARVRARDTAREGAVGNDPERFWTFNTNCKHFYSFSSSVSPTRQGAVGVGRARNDLGVRLRRHRLPVLEPLRHVLREHLPGRRRPPRPTKFSRCCPCCAAAAAAAAVFGLCDGGVIVLLSFVRACARARGCTDRGHRCRRTSRIRSRLSQFIHTEHEVRAHPGMGQRQRDSKLEKTKIKGLSQRSAGSSSSVL